MRTICQVAEGDKADIDLAARAARKALESGLWKRMDAADRGRLMYKLADRIEKEAGELAALESLNCGKTITDAQGDLQGVVNTLRYYAGWADKIEGRTVPVRGNILSYTLRQPVGVVGQIIPWNFPLLMLAWKWGPALVCGNTLVMKPAEQSPLTALRVAALAQEVGFPDGVINMIPGYGETAGAALVAHPDVDKIAFTGHVDTAKIIQKAAADTLKRVTFEAGEQEPQRDLYGRQHGGRRGPACASTPSIFTAASAAPPVAGCLSKTRFTKTSSSASLAKAKKRRGRRSAGRPRPSRGRRSPRSSSTKSSATSKSARTRAPKPRGRRRSASGSRGATSLRPTIFDNVKDDMTIAKDEIFGPVVETFLPFKSMDEVIERANNTSYGLAAAIWTQEPR